MFCKEISIVFSFLVYRVEKNGLQNIAKLDPGSAGQSRYFRFHMDKKDTAVDPLAIALACLPGILRTLLLISCIHRPSGEKTNYFGGTESL